MRRSSLCFFVLLSLAPIAIAKDKPQLPKLVVQAKYVLVTSYFGDELSNPRIMPDDRRAITDVQEAIKKWGRYIIVYHR